MLNEKTERREFVKKAAYVVPAILTLKALPAFAASGSGASRARSRSREANRGENETGQGQQSNESKSGR